MGVPTSEVWYTPAIPRREDHEVYQGHVAALGGGKVTFVGVWVCGCSEDGVHATS